MAEQRTRSIRQRWDDLQPSKTMLVWSCIGSVVVALVVGFTWGGWVTGGTARGMAESPSGKWVHAAKAWTKRRIEPSRIIASETCGRVS